MLDGLGMGVGFTAAMLLMGMIRELFGAGSLFGIPILSNFMSPVIAFILPPGGFFVFGMLIALANKLNGGKGKAPEEVGCAGCPMKNRCQNIKDGCKTKEGEA